jgi:hypothetical protein
LRLLGTTACTLDPNSNQPFEPIAPWIHVPSGRHASMETRQYLYFRSISKASKGQLRCTCLREEKSNPRPPHSSMATLTRMNYDVEKSFASFLSGGFLCLKEMANEPLEPKLMSKVDWSVKKQTMVCYGRAVSCPSSSSPTSPPSCSSYFGTMLTLVMLSPLSSFCNRTPVAARPWMGIAATF